MIRRIGSAMVGLVLLTAIPVYAGSFTIITTARQDAAIAWQLDVRNAQITAENARRAALTPPEAPLPLMTAEEVVRAWASKALREHVLDAYHAARKGALVTKFDEMTPAQQQAFLDQLGVSP